MSELEWQTRKERIDTRLRNMRPAWKIVPFREGLDTRTLHRVAVTEYPTKNGPADYALFVDGQLLGIIEAKKVGVNPQNVLEQAKRYAAVASDGPGLWTGLRVPFLYATNGEIIWFLDARDSKWVSRNLGHFHTADALEELFGRSLDPARKWLLDTPVEKIARLRGYQADCITSMESSLMDGKRQILVAMATGTGKTFTTVASIYRMLESGLAKRILFLVDRKALAAQADGADYLGCGAAFVTGTKLDAHPVTAETMRAVTAAVNIPVVAIGGIDAANLLQLQGRGLAGVAVVSAIFAQADPCAASRELYRLAGQL